MSTGIDLDKRHAQEELRKFGASPKIGVYRHRNGGLYAIIAVSLDEETLEPTVTYYSFERKTRWNRKLNIWSQKTDIGIRFLWERKLTKAEYFAAVGLDSIDFDPSLGQ